MTSNSYAPKVQAPANVDRATFATAAWMMTAASISWGKLCRHGSTATRPGGYLDHLTKTLRDAEEASRFINRQHRKAAEGLENLKAAGPAPILALNHVYHWQRTPQFVASRLARCANIL